MINFSINTNYPPSYLDRKHLIIDAINGDSIEIKSRITLNGELVNYDNSILKFVLKDQRFASDNIWEATWRDGIEVVDIEDHPGLVCITIPMEITEELRRGSYIFSLKVSDKLAKNRTTPVKGVLNIEYEPTSSTHEIPYRT